MPCLRRARLAKRNNDKRSGSQQPSSLASNATTTTLCRQPPPLQGLPLADVRCDAYLGPRVVLMMSATAFAAVMFPSCAARPVSLLVLTGRTITGALMIEPVFLLR